MKRIALLFLSCFAAVSLPAMAATATFMFEGSYTRPLVFREGAGSGTITVLRGGDMSSTASIDYNWMILGNVVGESGAGGQGTLTFGPNETSKTIPVTIPNDAIYTGGWWGQAYLHPQGGDNVDFRDIEVDDDEPAPALTAPPVSVPRGSGTTAAALHVTLSSPIATEAYAKVYVIGGTPTTQVDYALPSEYIHLQAFQTAFDVPVTINGGTEPRPDESIAIGVDIGLTWSLLHGEGIITILNDKYLIAPPTQQIELGSTGSLDLSTSVPAASTERVEAASDNPSIVSVPSFVDIPAGATTATIPITAESVGTASITVKLPASRGGASLSSVVSVFTPTSLSFDRPTITMSYGSQTTATVRIAPPPASPLMLAIVNSSVKVVDVPATFTIGSDGTGSIPVRATGTGFSFISTMLPPEYGAATGGFGVNVTEVTGLSISTLSSKSGPEAGEQAITLSGNNITGRCTVTFGGVSALNTAVAAAGLVTTYTPPHAPGVVDVGIRCGTDEFTLSGAYTYTAAPPRITAIAPGVGSPNGGTIVTASGENLPRGRCGLWFGNAPATTLTNLQTSEMSAVAPPHAAGAVAVTLRCGSDVSTLNDAFLYSGDEPAAEIAALSPSSGAPGDQVLVGGSRFRMTDTISFGSVPAANMTTAANGHVVTVPDLPAGPVTITLRDADGRTITGPSFTVRAPAAPQITSAPAKATAGSEIVVNGSGFRPSFVFTIAGVALRSVVVTPSYVILRLPSTVAPQQSTLVLRDASGASLASQPIEVTSSGVAVESASPQCTSTDGGTLVTITGSGFEPGAVVTFGIADATEVVVRDAQTIVARAPASSGVTDATITVTNPSLNSGQLTGFHYRWPESQCGGRHHAAGR